jgi:hypothetical protein
MKKSKYFKKYVIWLIIEIVLVLTGLWLYDQYYS